jgi:transcriptional regulator with XRE-family HTH domain
MFRNDRFRELRTNRHLTHEELADQLEVGVAQIWRYEKGKITPSGDVIARMAQVFEVSADYLLGLADDPTPYFDENNLSKSERELIAALRRGDRLEAVRMISAS